MVMKYTLIVIVITFISLYCSEALAQCPNIGMTGCCGFCGDQYHPTVFDENLDKVHYVFGGNYVHFAASVVPFGYAFIYNDRVESSNLLLALDNAFNYWHNVGIPVTIQWVEHSAQFFAKSGCEECQDTDIALSFFPPTPAVDATTGRLSFPSGAIELNIRNFCFDTYCEGPAGHPPTACEGGQWIWVSAIIRHELGHVFGFFDTVAEGDCDSAMELCPDALACNPQRDEADEYGVARLYYNLKCPAEGFEPLTCYCPGNDPTSDCDIDVDLRFEFVDSIWRLVALLDPAELEDGGPPVSLVLQRSDGIGWYDASEVERVQAMVSWPIGERGQWSYRVLASRLGGTWDVVSRSVQ
jgi:hypothetical protein